MSESDFEILLKLGFEMIKKENDGMKFEKMKKVKKNEFSVTFQSLIQVNLKFWFESNWPVLKCTKKDSNSVISVKSLIRIKMKHVKSQENDLNRWFSWNFIDSNQNVKICFFKEMILYTKHINHLKYFLMLVRENIISCCEWMQKMVESFIIQMLKWILMQGSFNVNAKLFLMYGNNKDAWMYE